MPNIAIEDFPPDRLADIVHWRNDPAVNTYLRPGIRTLDEVQGWYAQYFSRAEHKLFAVYADKTLIGYCTLEHIDTTHRSCEIGLVIGNPHYWNQGLGAMVVTRLTTLALTVYHLHRVYAVIQGGNRSSMRCFEKVGFQHEGRWRDARYVNGKCIDIHYYAILEHEWTSCTPGWLRLIIWESSASTPTHKRPTRPQCPCLACDAMMGGVKEGRSGTRGPQTHDVLVYYLMGFFWLDMVGWVRTCVLRSRGHL